VKRQLLFAPLFITAACSGFQDDSDLASSTSRLSVQPVYLPGNPTCQQLGFAYEGKVNSPPAGESSLALINGHVVTFTLSADKTSLSWSSPTLSLDAVIMKAANGAYIFTYDPEATSDSGLFTPNTQDNTGPNQAALSHVSFCYDFELVVEKTASTTFDRDHDWTIQKTAAETNVVLSWNQVYNLAFTVVVSAAGYTDSGWAVGGTITVTNPDPSFSADLDSVTDNLSGFGAIAVDCGVTFPYTLAPGASLVCTYATALPNGDTRTNTATVDVCDGSKVGGGSDSVEVVFSSQASTITAIDGCVDVSDTHMGSLGQVCAADGSQTFNYTVLLDSTVCEPYQLTNTASYEGTAESGSSTVVVDVEVACELGCTLTQGYWKTHSSYGPAPHDEDGWAGHENDMFFSSGQTQYQVLWTAPAGNAYYVLAHQYIAAARNAANGATFTAAQAAFDAATALFEAYTPAQVKAMKGNHPVRQQFTTLAYLLDQYNNGITGPGHCTE
jgi:hypothetical protein